MPETTRPKDVSADRRASYVDKVRKLLAKAEATTNQAEADAFYAKATELITAWRIEDAELAAAGGVDDLTKVSVPLGTYSPVADVTAMSAVLRPLGVRVAFTPYGGRGYPPMAHLYGYASDVAKAQLLWSSVSVQLAGACRVAEPYGLDRNQQRVWRQSFKLGYGARVGSRLAAATVTVTAASTSGGLVLARDGEVDRYISGEASKTMKSKLTVDARARAAGAAAASGADLGGARLGGMKGALK